MIKKIVLVGVIVLIALLFLYCTTDESTIIGPFGDAGKYLTVASLSLDKTTIYSKGDTSIVSIKVLDVNNSPAIGLKIDFTAQFGSITESATTDSSGIAFATFTSDENTGENIITIDTGIKKYTLTIEVINYQPKYIELFSESLSLLADGISSTTITAVLKDSVGNPMPDMTVNFTTTLGTLSSEAVVTNSEGIATTELTSATEEGIATVTASAGIVKSIDIKFYGPAYIELSAGSLVLLADGTSFTDITVVLKDSVGNPMPGMTINFTTSLGTLSSQIELTDANGEATTELTSATEEGIATVTASAGIVKSIDIKFQNYVPVDIELSAELPRLWADGESSTTITAVLKDSIGSPMPNMTVNFTTTLGTLSSQIELTDANGEATTVLTSSTSEGTAIVTATSYITGSVTVAFNQYVPSIIEISASPTTILADGLSTSIITATLKDSDGITMPNLDVLFSATEGLLSDTAGKTDQSGSAKTTLTSTGSSSDKTAIIKVTIVDDTSIFEDINIKLRGITCITYIDSAKMSDNGIYKAYMKTNLFETNSGTNIISGTVNFSSSSIGTMEPSSDAIDGQGLAFSVFSADVLGTTQSDITITSVLSSSSDISSVSDEFDIPGAEILINAINDDIMGDGVGWALVRATLRESNGHIAIPNTEISWSTTLGTIKGTSKTNTTGHTIDTLRIESAVDQNTLATITAQYGNNVSADYDINFVAPPSYDYNRLILGFAPDITGQGFIPCDIDTVEIGTKDMGITALLVDASSNPIGGEVINFQITPNNLAAICESTTTVGDENGRATVMVAYPVQNSGEIVRIWAETDTKTLPIPWARGSIDVILP